MNALPLNLFLLKNGERNDLPFLFLNSNKRSSHIMVRSAELIHRKYRGEIFFEEESGENPEDSLRGIRFREWTRWLSGKLVVFLFSRKSTLRRAGRIQGQTWIFGMKRTVNAMQIKRPRTSTATSQTRPTWHRKYLNVEEGQASTYWRMSGHFLGGRYFPLYSFRFYRKSYFFPNYRRWR